MPVTMSGAVSPPPSRRLKLTSESFKADLLGGSMQRWDEGRQLRSVLTERSVATGGDGDRKRRVRRISDVSVDGGLTERFMKAGPPSPSSRRHVPQSASDELITRGLTSKCAALELSRRARWSPSTVELFASPPAA